MRSPNSSARTPFARDLSSLGFIELQNWHVFITFLIEVTESSRKIQMSGPLLALRGGHVVVFQVKVLEVTLVIQLVDDVSECFTFRLLAKNRGILFSLARVP